VLGGEFATPSALPPPLAIRHMHTVNTPAMKPTHRPTRKISQLLCAVILTHYHGLRPDVIGLAEFNQGIQFTAMHQCCCQNKIGRASCRERV